LRTSRLRIRNSTQWIDAKTTVIKHATIGQRANGKWLGIALDDDRDGSPKSNGRIANVRSHDLSYVDAFLTREGGRRTQRQAHDAGDDAKEHEYDQQLDECDSAFEYHVGRTL